MLDQSIPYIGVLMTNLTPDDYPRCPLPEGYAPRTYEPGLGMEEDWARLQVSVEHFPTMDEARARFQTELAPDEKTLAKRGIFIYAPDGGLAASALLWYGALFGRTLARVHWVAVAPEHQGKGLCKAAMTRLMDLYHECGLAGGIYLTSQTWSYKALGIYRQFGFKPYTGPCPSGWQPTTDDFEQETHDAWKLIDQKLSQYRKPL